MKQILTIALMAIGLTATAQTKGGTINIGKPINFSQQYWNGGNLEVQLEKDTLTITKYSTVRWLRVNGELYEIVRKVEIKPATSILSNWSTGGHIIHPIFEGTPTK